jgi:hypothetical protein
MLRVLLFLLVLVVRIPVAPAEEPNGYFPKGMFSRHLSEAFSHNLKLLKEAPLQEAKTPGYRLLWMRSFDDIMVFRLDIQKHRSGVLTTKRLKSIPIDQGGKKFRSKLMPKAIRPLTGRAVSNFDHFMEKAEFFQRPSEDPFDSGTDGATWLLEAFEGGKYHATWRFSPVPPVDGNATKGHHEYSVDMASLFLMLLGGAADEEIY